MTPTPVRQKLQNLLTPKVADRAIVMTDSMNLKDFPEFGTPHPDTGRYPNHKFAGAAKADDAGLFYSWIYLAPREDQDDYNWEFTKADIGGTRFDAIQRTYITPRGDFDTTVPAMGAAGSLVPVGQIPAGHVLALRKQVRSGDQEIDSLFVVDVQTYVRRVSLTEIELDIQTGRSKDAVTTLYLRTEEIASGVTVGDVVADPNSPYRGLQANGTFREIKQLSDEWFSITVSRLIAPGTVVTPIDPEDPPTVINPPVSEVVDRPVPKVDDYIVHFKAAPAYASYGDAHPTRAGFFLTYIKPADEIGQVYEYFYAKSFLDQDVYNFEISQGDVLSRAYIIPRAGYLDGTALPPISVGTLVPATSTPAVLARYGYTHEYVGRADKELDSYFITVIRVFQKIVQTQTTFDGELGRQVLETATFIAKGTNSEVQTPGYEVVVDDTHSQYDRVTTRQLLPNAGDPQTGGAITFPIQLPTIPGRANFPVPPLLTRVSLEQQWAIAISDAPPAFDQDYYFDFKTIEPPSGPYEAQTLRFLTDNPQDIVDNFPLVRIAPVTETIGIASAWFFAHPEQNQAKANARQISVPPSIHGAIEINEPDGPTIGLITKVLPPTPGFAEFVSTGIAIADVNTSKTRFDLYIVSVDQVSIGGVYTGSTYSFGVGNTGGLEASVDTSTAPVVASATFSVDNTVLSGTATSLSSIRVFTGSGPTATELGQAVTDPDGLFSVVMNTVFVDATSVSVTARLSGKTSAVLTATANDLAPAAPTVFLLADNASLIGYSEPGATITIAPDPIQQEITLTLTGTATADGTAAVEFSTAFITSSPFVILVDFLNTETASQVAVRVRAALVANSAISAMFDVDVSGPDVVMTKKVSAPNDASAYLNIAGEEGIGTDTSTITIPGRGTTTVTADGSGNFTYTFDPALTDGVSIVVTATDGGGTSPAVTIVSSSTVPATPTATLDDPGTISGTGTIGSVVIATYQGVQVGTDTVDGAGDYEMTLTRLFISGEEIFVYAHAAGDSQIRSAATSVTAGNLGIPKPVISTVEDLHYGTMPASLLAEVGSLSDITVVVREMQGAMASHEVTIAANYEWSFSIETLFSLSMRPENGERFEVFYRLSIGAGDADGPAEIIAYPVVPIVASSVAWTTPMKSGQLTNTPFFLQQESNGVSFFGSAWATEFPEFITVFSTGARAPQVGILESETTGVVTFPGSRRLWWTIPDADKNIAWVKVSYMGDGTVVRVRYPGSALATDVFTLVTADGYAFKERVNIPIIQWPYAGSGGKTDPDMTITNLKNVIPPIIEVEVISPDGRSGKTTFQRSSYHPFR